MERFLLFTVGGVGHALALREVAEVREPPAHSPLPRVPDHLIGMMNHHGAPTALLDLALWYGNGCALGDGKVLVLDPKRAALALWVDGVTSIVAEETILGRREGDSPFALAVLETEFGLMRLLNLEALVAQIERELTGK